MLLTRIQIDAYDPIAGAAVSVFAGSHDDPAVCHSDNGCWWPALAKLPTLRYDFFDGAFGDQITAPSSSLVLQTEPWPNFGRYSFADAPFKLWTADSTAPNAWTLRFDGRVTEQPESGEGVATVPFAVDDRWLDTPFLATYAGTTGAEGPLAMKGQAKPFALGAPRYVPGKLIDSVNSVFQVSNGPVQEFEAALERAVRFGAPVADHATYAALIAATIPAGAWATAKAVGMARFGAPTTGQISFLIKGDNAGVDGWARKPGQLIRRIAQLSGGGARIDDASLAALDAARPYNLSLYLDEQTTARELIQRIAASVNAVAVPSWTGKLFVLPVAISAPTMTLAADGSSLPPVGSIKQIGIAAPWAKLAMTAERTWTVHGMQDIAFTATLLPVGLHSASAIYREGNIVDMSDGSRFLYIAAAPSAGNAPPPATFPPAAPATNAWWYQQSPPTTATRSTWSGVINDNGRAPSDNAGTTLSLYDYALALGYAASATIQGNTAAGTGTSWSGVTYSRQFYRGGAYASATPKAGAFVTIFGLAKALNHSTVGTNYNNIDFGFYQNLGTLYTWSKDGGTTTIGAFTGQQLSVVYDGYDVLWHVNGVQVRTQGAVGTDLLMYFGATFAAPFGSVADIQFGASTNTARSRAAQADADRALADLIRVASDGWLTRGEKPEVILKWNTILGELNDIVAKADALGVNRDAYRSVAFENLYAYINGLSPGYSDTSQDTPIVGATFQAKFTDYYTARQALLNAIDTKASQLAIWSGVTGPNRPSDNAGTSGTLTPIGAYTTVQGNSVTKSGGVHGAYQGGVVGRAGLGTCFISSSMLNVTVGGGWYTTLGLDDDAISYDANTNISYTVVYVATGVGSGTVYLNVGPSNVAAAPVSGLAASARLALIYDGTSIWVQIDGVKLLTQTVAANQRLFPKVLDFHQSGSSGFAITDIQHGPWTDNGQAKAAQQSAADALADLANIASDNMLTRGEKPGIIQQQTMLSMEATPLILQAAALGVSYSAYQTAVNALATHLVSLSPGWSDTSQDTPIVGVTFRSKFQDVYDTKQTMLNAIDLEASKRATWVSVTGPGRPSDNAGTTLHLSAIGTNPPTIQGNTISRSAAGGDNFISAAVGTVPYAGSANVSCDIRVNSYTMVAFDDDATSYDRPQMSAYVQYNSADGSWSVYYDGVLVEYGVISASLTGQLRLTYDGLYFRAYVNAFLLNTHAATPGLTLYPKWLLYPASGIYTGLYAGPGPDRAWANIGGPGRPSDGATSDQNFLVLPTGTLVGNSLTRNSGTGDYAAMAYTSQPLRGPQIVGCDIRPDYSYTMVALDDDASTSAHTHSDMLITAHYQYSAGQLNIYSAGVVLWTAVIGQYAGRLEIDYDGSRFTVSVGGAVYYQTNPDFKSAAALYGKVWAYNSGAAFTGLQHKQLHTAFVGLDWYDARKAAAGPANPAWVVRGNTLSYATNSGWVGNLYSKEYFTGSASLSGSFVGALASSYAMFGLSDGREYGGVNDWQYLRAGFYNDHSALAVCESGTITWLGLTYTGQQLQIVYDGTAFRYLVDGELVRSTATTAGRTFYAAAASAAVSSASELIRVTAFTAAQDQAIPLLSGQTAISFAADYTGTLKTGQLSRTFSYKLMKGSTDVTSSAAWSIVGTPVGGSFAVGAATGIVTVSAITASTGKFVLRWTYAAVSKDVTVEFSRADDAPPFSTGSSGNPGTSGTASMGTSTNSSSYGTAYSDAFTCVAGTAGQIALSASLSTSLDTSTNGNYSDTGYATFELRPIGGSWADVGSEMAGNIAATVSKIGATYEGDVGSLDIARTKTGLTAGSSYEARLKARKANSGVNQTLNFGGTLSGVGS